jgi:transglutaminase-like putative cysteine protease
MTIPTFTDLLALLGTPAGSWALITVFASLALEKWSVWAEWYNPTAKKYIMVALAAGLVLGIQYLGTRPDILVAIEPVYTWIATFIGGWLALEVTHKVNKKLS